MLAQILRAGGGGIMCEHEMSATYEIAFCKHCHLTVNELSLMEQLESANAKFEQHTECYLRTIKALDEQISAANARIKSM